MCEPTTIALVASLALTAAAGYVAYDSSKKAQKYNEQVQDQKIKVSNAQALDAERLGQIERQERRQQTRMQLATQQVGFGAQNVETTGTALDILGDTAIFGEIDENRITANAERKAFGYKYEAWGAEADKRLGAFKGKNDRTGILLTTASSLVGGVAGGFSSGAFGGGAGASGGGQFAPMSMGSGVSGPR